MADFITQNKLLVGITGLSLAGLGAVLYFAKKKKQPIYNRKSGVDYPKDTVIVQVGLSKGRYVPTAGQFNLKLMTYMRAAGIPYKAEFSGIPGPKGKIPWIEYNDIVMGDSQLIINFCNKTFNKDLNQSLSREEKALACAIQRWIEEFIYWLNVQSRWVLYVDDFLTDDLDPVFQNPTLAAHLKQHFASLTHAQGVGRHTQDEISEMITHEFRQFSAILGNKKYIMGDQFTEVDSSAFGILANIYYQTPAKCAGRQLLMNSDEMKNVRDYLERIKTQYWPDWDQLTMK